MKLKGTTEITKDSFEAYFLNSGFSEAETDAFMGLFLEHGGPFLQDKEQISVVQDFFR